MLKIILIFLVVLFIIVYVNKDNNYNINEQIISDDAIERFEKDLKEGKEIDPINYITPKKDYNNALSLIGLRLSSKIDDIVNKILNKLLESIMS